MIVLTHLYSAHGQQLLHIEQGILSFVSIPFGSCVKAAPKTSMQHPCIALVCVVQLFVHG